MNAFLMLRDILLSLIIFSYFNLTYSQTIPQRPLILVPGWAASALYATNNKETIRVYENWIQSDYVLKNFLWCKFNKNTNFTESLNTEYKIVVPLTDNGLFAIDNLNPDDPDRPRYYFNQLIKYLKSIGYESGKTLFGFPYDWRQSTLIIAKQLRKYVTEVLTKTKAKEVDIISHSMGGVVVKTMLALSETQDVHTWITVASPFKRDGLSWIERLLCGTDLNNPNLNHTTVHAMLVASPSSYLYAFGENANLEELPTLTFYNNTKVDVNPDEAFEIVKQALKNYRVDYYGTIVNLSPEKEMLDLEREAAELRKNIVKKPKYFYNINGVLYETPHSIEFPEPISGDFSKLLFQTPKVTKTVSGDYVVSYDSQIGDGFETCPLCRVAYHLSHNNLIRNTKPLGIIRHFLGMSCSWEGLWNVTYEDKFTEQIRTRQYGWTVSSETYSLKATVLGQQLRGTLIGSYGNATFELVQSDNCTSFEGFWEYTWGSGPLRWTGKRVIGSECKHGEKRDCYIENGKGFQTCQFGFWNEFCEIEECDASSEMTVGQPAFPSKCLKVHETWDIFQTILLICMALFSICTVLFIIIYHFVMRKNKQSIL